MPSTRLIEALQAMAIVGGAKTVELRRRRMHVEPDSRVWIYTKGTVAKIQCVAFVDRVETLSIDALWALFSREIGISEQEYRSYVAGLKVATALILKDISPIEPVSLECIRRAIGAFQPPQFYTNITKHPLLSLLDEAAGFTSRRAVA